MDIDEDRLAAFQIFNEIGIINQLATTEFNRLLPEGLHISHFTVINSLVRVGEGRTPVELARAFQVTKQTMTNTVLRLSERGFIEIRDNPEDRRSKLIYLSDAGRAFREKAIAAVGPMLGKIAELDAFDDLKEALPTLQRLRSFLDAMRDS